MTDRSPAGRVGAILLDIEGTTTPISFVTKVLFPYARTHLRSYLERHAASREIQALLVQLHKDHGVDAESDRSVPAWIDDSDSARLSSAAEYVEWLMDRDRKSTALKELQGRIWESGYQQGELVSDIFPDVPRALQRWHERGIPVSIFSSGSVAAQQLLFRYSTAGDLTRWLHAYFDTRIGPKVDADSYRRIARELGLDTDAVLFISDATRELDAAHEAGMHVRLSERPGNARPPDLHGHQVVGSFDEVLSA